MCVIFGSIRTLSGWSLTFSGLRFRGLIRTYTVWLQSGHSVSGSKGQFYCRIQVLTGATQNTKEARLHLFLELSSHKTGYMLNVDDSENI